ncbi:MAG: prolipoprotein diacylglyceryl transferase [Candidatus Omnitrophica bacterium]|nr:prolipoprotein diacylglyceryl transferase [Candidatus Omnitrophota bacterium]
MYPILFEIGQAHLYSYGLMFALGVLAAVFYLSRRPPVAGLETSQIIDLILILTFVGILGGRVFYILQHWDYYLENPLEVFAIWQGGLVIYGGLIAAVAALAVFSWIRRVHFFELTDLYFPAVSLAMAFGRVGCFLNGCCWGTPSNLPWAVQFPFLESPVHPTQLYFALFDLILFLFLAYRYPRRCFTGEITVMYLVLYGQNRFTGEFFRGDNLPVLWGMTQAQLISLGFVLAAGVLYLFYFRPKLCHSHANLAYRQAGENPVS